MLASRATQVRTLLLYAQDDKGLGHVNRTLTIARHLLAAYPNCVAYIATKSPLAGFTLPERCDYIKLPTLLTSRTIQRSEEHTSELQSRLHLVCRLLLEKKKPLRYYDQTPYVYTITRF